MFRGNAVVSAAGRARSDHMHALAASYHPILPWEIANPFESVCDNAVPTDDRSAARRVFTKGPSPLYGRFLILHLGRGRLLVNGRIDASGLLSITFWDLLQMLIP